MPLLGKRTIGYYCSPDLRDAATLLNHATLAKKAGFSAIWVSDHFHPWYHTNANQSQTWVWMSAAMQAIPSVPFGSSVTAPIHRYHPAIIAQAFATLEAIHGRRVILGLGTGEAFNELPLGFPWPKLPERRKRLIEAIEIIRKLWTGERVDFRGEYFTLKGARLYMRAKVPIYVAGLGPKMARVAGEMADGFITFNPAKLDLLRSTILPEIDSTAASVGRSPADIKKVFELDVVYDDDYDKALRSVRYLAATLVTDSYVNPISDPLEMEELGRQVTDEQLATGFAIGTTPEEHIKQIEEAFDAGFDHVYVEGCGPNEERTIEMYGKSVLPYFRE